jgi:hypothetical protein
MGIESGTWSRNNLVWSGLQDIVTAVGVARSAAYSPLVQAMMVFQDEGKLTELIRI